MGAKTDLLVEVVSCEDAADSHKDHRISAGAGEMGEDLVGALLQRGAGEAAFLLRISSKHVSRDGGVGGDEAGDLLARCDIDKLVQGGEFKVRRDFDKQRPFGIDFPEGTQDFQQRTLLLKAA